MSISIVLICTMYKLYFMHNRNESINVIFSTSENLKKKQTKNCNENLNVLLSFKRHKLNFLNHSVFPIGKLGSEQLEKFVTKIKLVIFIIYLIGKLTVLNLIKYIVCWQS